MGTARLKQKSSRFVNMVRHSILVGKSHPFPRRSHYNRQTIPKSNSHKRSKKESVLVQCPFLYIIHKIHKFPICFAENSPFQQISSNCPENQMFHRFPICFHHFFFIDFLHFYIKCPLSIDVLSCSPQNVETKVFCISSQKKHRSPILYFP